jgi:SAM-dependent methyltransferase
MRLFVKVILMLVLLPYLLNQVRKPTRWTGRFFAWIMNLSHSGLTDWGLSHVGAEKQFTILDVGCGGGRTIEKLAAVATEGKVCGVDYAKGSVAASRAKNARLIQSGRVEVLEGSVSSLPFTTNQFDLVTAIETQYYWPNLVTDMQEILRVLKPGGSLAVTLESYKSGRYDKLQRPVMKFLNSSHLGVEEERELFVTAGFKDVEVFEERKKGWLCAVGRKA